MSNHSIFVGLFNTLDSKVVLPADKCDKFNTSNLVNNVILIWGVWWGSHSILARKAYKVTATQKRFNISKILTK